MAAVLISPTALDVDGVNLTDAAYTALTAGAGNGVKFLYDENLEIFLKNATGLTATYTILVAQPASVTAAGLSVPNKTVSVADGKTYILPAMFLYKDDSGYITIECDQTASIALFSRP